MESVLHNDYRQQPIVTDEAWQHYRRYLGRLEELIAAQEDEVLRARASADTPELSRARTALWRLLTKRQGVADAVAAYEREHTQTR